ncbi:glycosyltransferase [Candidatus Laterigemmans baculatus]|uniref:glycosyltransferase n=1 Tax=Candidatus Laterigemmans baculatus TaxID=2770505 RepID=UPI0013DD51F0|nr:glycosyltransferase [Candidatus Laterigemmans baculatus]
MAQKTILQLLHSLDTGGAEVLADRLGQRLSNSYRVLFACLDQVGEIGERLIARGYQVEQLHRRPGIDWNCVRRLSQFVRREQIDLIHAHQYTPFFYAMAARIGMPGVPIVFTEHGRFFPDYRRRRRVWFNRALLRRQDRLIAVGHDVKRALVDNDGLPTERVEVIHNGIPVEAFNPEHFSGAKDRLRAELGLSSDAVVAVQVARLDALKDHLTAVRSIALASTSSNVHLLVVGEGAERGRIETEIAACGVSERVHLLGLRRDIPQLLAASDILLLSSISEGIPLTVLEGMAAELPIVATDVGGLKEIVADRVHGFLCPARDPTALAERLVQLGQQAALRHQMGRAGRQWAAAHFSEESMHRSYEQAIASVVDRRAAVQREARGAA